jgi:hypothetical protein
VTLLWRGDPIVAVDLAEGAGGRLDWLSAGPHGPYGVVCHSASVSGLPASHALCRRPDCACLCHVPAAALLEAG